MSKKYTFLMILALIITLSSNVYAMHIAEGSLPPVWCGVYVVLSIPFVFIGLKHIRKRSSKNKDIKMLLGLVAAYSFVLSAMKIPSITGSCSHPTGTGLGAILFGPFTMAVIGLLVLLFQAIFLAHGGITTLGANAFSMGIVGPIVSYIIFRLVKRRNKKAAVFLAAMLGDLATYLTTSVQLALAIPDKTGGVLVSFIKFFSIFAITQIPLAIIEGILTVIIFEFIENYSSKEIKDLIEV
ncbi:energy-coupling factor ABC transporter permease [Clostridium sp. DJ247]|uniref:energy-coupling factor ABC transporter permease n=1 Tax=Clostridium sp. DJ247 TaxID=2726188 RepID=UPI00162404F2|nr:energy-coupling factor ABC transporter permease [Clostridium sp. DJ247]MBC2580771.1 energy-coupling factor ABC transporter permease [Clostridium sp. DJ247]